jgi:ABC-type branched-subunit amino acid transport system substrate-binding protein
MKKNTVLIIRPEGDDSSPEDQTFAARLAAGPEVEIREQRFRRDEADDLARQLRSWEGEAAGVIGAMRVPESQRLGQWAERMNLLCLVANNNPAVWQNRRNIFHIGFPTTQTTAAVAAELTRSTNRRRYLMLHDATEFQTRVAATMEARLRESGMEARSLAHNPGDALDIGADGWKPELIYVVFSSERKALKVVQTIGERMPDMPLVLGRSLLRESFLQSLNGRTAEFWFVDTNFRRSRMRNESQERFVQVMAENGVKVPTTNHAFGWDCMKFCAVALQAGDGDAKPAIEYLESGVTLEGATGTCSFSPDNHNGRRGPGPTILSRWTNGRFEDL